MVKSLVTKTHLSALVYSAMLLRYVSFSVCTCFLCFRVVYSGESSKLNSAGFPFMTLIGKVAFTDKQCFSNLLFKLFLSPLIFPLSLT